MYRTVLLAVDGSSTASKAARQGIEVAAVLGATLHAVSVVEGDDDAAVGTTGTSRVESARSVLEDVAEEAAARDVSVVTAVRAGRPGRELLAYADEEDVDLAVLGTHGRSRVRRLVAGSVATTVVREARCPVLTVGRSASVRREFDDVLVATDGRPGTERAIEHGLALAEAYGATVHAVYVVNDVHSRLPVVLKELERVGEEATSEVEDLAAERGVSAVRSVEHGIPHDRILGYAREEGVDLIVSGTESRSGLDRIAFGSVSQRIVSDAPAPVMTVRDGVR